MEYLDLYITELLKSRKIQSKDEKFINNFVCKIKTCLEAIPKKDVWSFAKGLASALDEKDEKLIYRPPNSVTIVGGHAWHTAHLTACVDVDLLVEVPKECIHAKDYLNEGVLRRRAQYLKIIAAILIKSDLVKDVKYLYSRVNNKKPLLVVLPKEKSPSLDQVRVLINIAYEKGTFKLNRFHVMKNNIRRRFYYPESDIVDSREGIPTPFYNALVLGDLMIAENNSFIEEIIKKSSILQQAIILLKIWMEKRHLNEGFQYEFFWAAFVAYLYKKQLLRGSVKPLEIYKLVLEQFCQADLKTCGVSLHEGEESNDLPRMDEFHESYRVVFVDCSGFWNICANLNECHYDNIKYEAQESLKLLMSSHANAFQHLFLDDCSFPCKFDHILHIFDSDELKQLCKSRKSLQDSVLNCAGNHVIACTDPIISVLRKALDKRIHLIGYMPESQVEVKVSKKMNFDDVVPKKMTFGLLIDKFHATCDEVRGPSANQDQEVAEFQKFWGDKAEQHRYRGGEIIECVKWPVNTVADGRNVISRIIRHVLNRHFNINKEHISISGNQFDKLLKPTESKNSSEVSIYGTGEEQHCEVIKAMDQLRSDVTSMKGLPLLFNSFFGLSPIFRFAEVFPPVKSASQYHSSVYNHRLVPIANGKSPQYFPSIKVLCLLERNGEWPKDREAVRRLKGRFYLEMADHLEKLGYMCHVDLDGMSTFRPKETFTFRLEIGYMREIAATREMYTKNNNEMLRDSEESIHLKKNYVLLPELTSLLHSLHQQNSSYSCSVRLAKRWLSSQLLYNYIPEEALELCVAYLYTSSRSPSSPLLGFAQFLHLVSTHDWKLEPLIVNLNNDFTEMDFKEIRKNFNENRTILPDMFIATPGDKNSAAWTSSGPSSIFLTRMAIVAKASLEMLCELLMNPPFSEKSFKVLFRPPVSDYNLLIHLEPSKCSRAHLGIDFHYDSANPPPKKSSRPDNLLPVIDYDPPVMFLEDLKEKFSKYALFFYDIFGGKYIAVAWKASAFKPQPFEKNHEKIFKIIEESLISDDICMRPDEEKIITEFYCLGHGLVSSIEVIKKLNL